MRRMLTLVLSVSLTGVGPVPLSLCAIFSSKLAECSTPTAQSPCDSMNMGESGTAVVAPTGPCCNLDNAPVATRQHQFAQPLLTNSVALPVLSAVTLPGIERTWPNHIEESVSPPPLQSLLCTFLV